jgi:hypothetical protein
MLLCLIMWLDLPGALVILLEMYVGYTNLGSPSFDLTISTIKVFGQQGQTPPFLTTTHPSLPLPSNIRIIFLLSCSRLEHRLHLRAAEIQRAQTVP